MIPLRGTTGLRRAKLPWAFATSLLWLANYTAAQTPAVPPPTNEASTTEEVTPTDEETIVLSPFVVDTEADEGSYTASATLLGSRVRTELKDVASSISVVTPQFLQDIGATNSQTLLQYTTNTEVGGIGGNMAGVGGLLIDGASESSSFIRPSQNTRVRGLDSADNTRDLFRTDLPWDSYNVGSVELQRGANSILFGFGSPAGIINTSLNLATLNKTKGTIEHRVGSFGSVRASIDYNLVIKEGELAVRVAGLDDHTKYRQKPAFNRDQRLFGAVHWRPDFLSDETKSTIVRVNYEHGSVRANRPRSLPPWDHINPFFDPQAINRQTWDPYYAWEAGIVSYSSGTTIPGEKENYWLVQYPGPGLQATANPIFTYDNAQSGSPISIRQAGPTTYFGLNSAGARDGSIDGFPYGSNIGIGHYGAAANNHWRVFGNTGDATTGLAFPAADKGFYKRKSLTDDSIFDFYNILIDGPNKREWQRWDAFNVALEQLLFSNRLGLQFVYDYQDYEEGQTRNINDPYISVDVRSHLMDYPAAYGSAARVNPNAGRAFVGSSAKNGGNSANFTERENLRFTAFGELRADDFLDKSLLTSILGRHVVNGVLSQETYDVESRNWARYAVAPTWSAARTDPANDSHGLANGDVVIDWVTYLSGDLRSRTSAAGLDLPGVAVVQAPSGTVQIPYFDSHWTATGVNPGDPWFNPARGLGNTPPGVASTQSENPFNYRGWVNGSFEVLNADEGDIEQLYLDVSRRESKTTSQGVTLQSYLWDGNIVFTYGVREDRLKTRSGNGNEDVASGDPATPNPALGAYGPTSKGTSTTWGVVLHTPKALREKLPYGANLSLSYSNGENMRVEDRYGFSGAALPNSAGTTEDYSVILRLFDDRLVLKATHYETINANANLASVTTEVSTLGSNTYYLRNLEAWGTATVMTYLRARQDPSYLSDSWFWNWALVDSGWDGQYESATGAPFLNHPSTAKQTAAINSWLSQMQPESFYAAYGFNINHAAATAGNWANAFPGWSPTASIGGIQPSAGGRIAGTWPTGTVDYTSKGWEFEVVGRVTKNLNVSLNASKTHASQTALGADLVSFVESQYAKYQSPAGDIRLWWGGGDTFRKVYTENIWAAYQFQVQTNGKLVPEMAPWRFNGIVKYNFDAGALKGIEVGVGYRWEQGKILGYALNEAGDNLDVDNPYWSDAIDNVDGWVGYGRKLTDKLDWRIQLNLRNIGEDPHLIPISVQPDGSPAGFRIAEGMTWQVTNTFSF